MEKLYSYIPIAFLTICLTGCASYSSKNNDLTRVLSKTQQTMVSLGDQISASKDTDLSKAYDQLEKKGSELFPLLEKCNEKYPLSAVYMSTLQEAEKVLRRLGKKFDETSNKKFVLEAVHQDYEAKLQTINNTAKNDAGTKIKVTVNSNEEEGFFVFGKLSFEQGRDIKRFRFNQPTQNAVQDFVPGYYLFWLEKEDRVGEPELHLIMSSSGEVEKKLVLKTPK